MTAMLMVNRHDCGDTSVFRCAGRIVAGEEVARLKKAILCHQSGRVIILDLSSVSALDGAGLGLLAFLAGWTRVIGIKLKVLNPSGRVRQLLELTHLDSVLEFCDSEFSSELVAQSASTVTADALLHR